MVNLCCATSIEQAWSKAVCKSRVLFPDNLWWIWLDCNPLTKASLIISDLYCSTNTVLKSQSLANVFNSFNNWTDLSPAFCFLFLDFWHFWISHKLLMFQSLGHRSCIQIWINKHWVQYCLSKDLFTVCALDWLLLGALLIEHN